jgi:alpha-galactosidase
MGGRQLQTLPVLLLLLFEVRAVVHRPSAPPLGFNSFLQQSCNESNVLGAGQLLDGFVKNAVPAGYSYFCIDGGWGANTSIDRWGRGIPRSDIWPSQSFVKVGAAAVKGGAKFGLWAMHGIPYGAVAAKSPVKGTNYTADQLVNASGAGGCEKSHQCGSGGCPASCACRWDGNNAKLNTSHPGARAYYDSVVELWAEWGVDLIKVDCIFAIDLSLADIALLSAAIEANPRPIVFSLSPGNVNGDASTLTQRITPMIEAVRPLVTMARVTVDFHRNWGQVQAHFPQAADLAPLGVRGGGKTDPFFIDLDMVCC